jgi:8-oxo-dGTP pyrophosphatase MutT (NUDIX family)
MARLSRLYKRLAYQREMIRRLQATPRRSKNKETVSSIAVFNSDGHLLFGLRNDTEKFTMPGGHAEDGEDPYDAAIRELWEESGLRVDDLEYLGDGYGGREGNVHVFCYKAIVDGTPTSENDPDDECSVWSWVDISDGVPEIVLDNLHNKKNITLELLDLLNSSKKKADVNIVDEPHEDLIELSQPSTYPAGEEIGQSNSYHLQDLQRHTDSGSDQLRSYTAQASMRMYHGSPYGGLDDFDNVRPPIFFTLDKNVARQYALGQIVGAQADPGTTNMVPTIYTVDISGVSPFDMRRPEHMQMYEQVRPAYNIENHDDRAPPLHAEGFIQSGFGLPNYGQVRLLWWMIGNHGFDSVWVDEGTQGISLAIFQPHGKIIIIDKQEVSKTAGGFGYNLEEIGGPGLGGTSDAIMSDEHNVGENTQEDPDLKLGEVSAPYSDEMGALSDEVDDDKKYNVVRGASHKMADLIKKARFARQLDPNLGYRFTCDNVNTPNGMLTKINVYSVDGQHVASSNFVHQGKNIVPGYVVVDDDHQRLGIASAMHTYAEQQTGKKIVRSTNETPEGAALWDNNSSRQFGTDEKSAVALPDNSMDENKYDVDRSDVSIPRDPLNEGPEYGR